MIIYRTMNGRTGFRMGGNPPTGVRQIAPWMALQGMNVNAAGMYGIASPLNTFALTAVRHMYDYGTTSEQLAHDLTG